MNFTTLQKKYFSFMLLVFCLNLLMGCNRYFMPVLVSTPTMETKQVSLKKLSTENKFFIVRKKDHSYAMENVALDESNLALKGSFTEVPIGHHLYVDAIHKNYKIPKNGGQQVVLEEVHLFVSDTTTFDIHHPVVIPLSAVEKIEVIGNDKQLTTLSYLLGAAGIIAGALLVAAILFLGALGGY